VGKYETGRRKFATDVFDPIKYIYSVTGKMKRFTQAEGSVSAP